MVMKMYDNLVEAAKTAAQNSLCTKTNNKSGAALLSKDGKIYCGINVEGNGGTVFAEAVALVNAVADGKTKFLALAVFSDTARNLDDVAVKNLLDFGDMWAITCFDNKNESTLLSRIVR